MLYVISIVRNNNVLSILWLVTLQHMLLSANDQTIVRNTERGLQMAVDLLHRIRKDFGLQISTFKTKVVDFHGVDPVRCLLYTSRCV